MALEAKVRLTLEDRVSRGLKNIFKQIHGVDAETYKVLNGTSKWSAAIQESINKTKKLQSEFKKNNTLVDEFGRKLKGIFAAYGGVMTIRAVIDLSDTITGAENRLNYANGGDTAATDEAMDKMYAASQRARTGYADMMKNVGKSMALAGDTAFKGNIDNAIKFQEIMAKSYALGGASAAEQASSMYQMVQALGSGILQGDELRSVREGAPIAYKEIEKFAQGVYDTDESLKDLASDGKITSDIVVAAMLNAGDSIDEAFGKTDMTISQAFTNIKNTAVNSFRPIQDTINNFLNSDKGAKLINGISIAIQGLIGILNHLITLFINGATYIVDNWSWIQYIVYGVATAILFLAIFAIGQQLWKAILMIAANPFTLWIIGIALVIAGIIYLANTAVNGCEFIYNVAYYLAMGIIILLGVVFAVYLATGTLIMSTTAMTILLIIALVALLVMAIVKYGQQIGGFIGGLVGSIVAIFNNGILFVKKGFSALTSWLGAACENIEIFFNNLWNGAKAAFWDFIYGILDGLSWLEAPFNAIAKLFGLEGVTLSGITSTAKSNADAARSNIKSYNDLSAAWSEGYSTGGDFQSVSDAWNAGSIKGAEIGANVQNAINSAFDSAKFGLSSLGSKITGGLDKALGIDRNFNANDPALGLNTTDYDPSKLAKGVDNIDKNTGSIKDSMELTEEDLEYLRKVADMEWKKEFTTANITVDMSNYNTISGDGDLDGIVTKLADKLYEEMDAVANGVYG